MNILNLHILVDITEDGKLKAMELSIRLFIVTVIPLNMIIFCGIQNLRDKLLSVKSDVLLVVSI